MNKIIRENWHHIAIFVFFVIISVAYFPPALQGEMLERHDVIQAKAMQGEMTKYEENNDEHILWTNAMFSGMPTFQIEPWNPGSIATYIFKLVRHLFPKPAHILILFLVGFYILGLSFNLGPWLSLIGAVSFTFASYNLISIDAGHMSKVRSIALMAPILAGAYQTFRGRYITGFLLILVFSSLQIKSNHYQITYYLLIILSVYFVYEFVNYVKSGAFKKYASIVLMLLVAGILATASNASLLLTTYDYATHTIRGGASELSTQNESDRSSGLDKDYAMRWSYGIGETMTLLIPNFKGGASTESLGEDSHTYKFLTNNRVPASRASQMTNQLPTYWGSQAFTAGPIYFGAGSIFLFILSLFVIRSNYKWWMIILITLSIMLAWGKNFEPLANFFFNYVPLYNKFRTPSMILSIAQLLIPFMGILGLYEIVSRKFSWKELKNKFYISYGLVGGLCLIFFLLGGTLFSFEAPADETGQSRDKRFYNNYLNATDSEQFAQGMMEALRKDRAEMLQDDALRSFVIISLIALGIWLFTTKKINFYFLVAIVATVTLVDLWSIDKRYLNEESFVKGDSYEQFFPMRQADRKILQDSDLHFRVHDQTIDPYNDALPAKYHKLAGGYHAAKLQKYQDLIEFQLRTGNMDVFNMLNTKYFVENQNNQAVARQNSSALGNAWFINDVQWESTPRAIMNALDNFSPDNTAVINQENYKDYLDKESFSGNGSIRLVSYHPEKMVYQSNSDSLQLAVFSEVFYNGNKDWISKIDGEVQKHIRANYVLRAMKIPAGKHKIVFEFKPMFYYTGQKIAYASSGLILLLLIGLPLYTRYYSKK